MTAATPAALRKPSTEYLAEFFSADRIKAMRESAGYTQAELANEVGLLGARRALTVSAWENGRKRPDPRSLQDLWRVYSRLVRAGKIEQ